ncbi:MAG: hypothetical protein WCP86_06675, partial [bacterium]
MIWYIIRRILYMVPTLFGIILITFVLFNVIGDDPALAKLGKQVSPQRLEDFDIPRGYNKPLIAGSWGKIRAYGDSDFGTSSGPWRMVPGVVHSNKAARIILAAGAEYQIPLAFDLYPNEQFKWEIVYCLSNAPGTGATDVHAKAALCWTNAPGLPQSFALKNSSGQQTLSIPFQTGPDTAAL